MKKPLHILATALLFCLLLSSDVWADHYYGAYITYTRDQGVNADPRKVHLVLTLYQNLDSDVQDTEIKINMGDGNFQVVKEDKPRHLIIPARNRIVKTTFSWTYTYPSDGTFTVSWNGMNRNNNILNIAAPSYNYSFYVANTVNINSLRGVNSSPRFIAPESIWTKVGKRLEYNLLAYDAEGDSLAYRLLTPMHGNGQPGKLEPVPGYTLPNRTFTCSNDAATGNSNFSLDPLTGQLVWDAPCRAGTYSIAIAVEEWKASVSGGQRFAVKTGEVLYDVLITAFDHPDDGLTIQNQEDLVMSHQGYVVAEPGKEITLNIAYNKLTPAPTPNTEDNEEPFKMFASDLSKEFQADIKYAIVNTANGPVGTFTFTLTQNLARERPYFLNVYGRTGNSAVITHSIGLQIGRFPPRLVLLDTNRLKFTEEGHIETLPFRTTKLTVFVAYAADYILELHASSILAENAEQFSFTTRDSANSKVGELLFRPKTSQAKDEPQKITFSLIAQHAGTGSTPNTAPVTDELNVLVAIKPPKGSKDELDKERIVIRPNPISDKLLLQSDFSGRVYFYSTNGALVWEHPVLAGSNEMNRPARLSAGLYFYTIITTDGHKKTGKLVLL